MFSGTSLVTTEPAATTALLPILTPFNIIDRSPIHTLSPISTGLLSTKLYLSTVLLFQYVIVAFNLSSGLTG